MTGTSAFEVVAADAFSPAELLAANLAAFADYIVGPIHMTLDQWPAFVARQGVDLARSRVAVRDGAIVAFGFVCPRPEQGRWRLSGMGALPAARGTGAAPALLDDFVARAASEGVAVTEMECFAANERALRLYRSRGFEVVQVLNGWKLAQQAPAPVRDAREPRVLERAQGLAWLDAAMQGVAALPFQCSPRSLAAQTRPLTFWQLGAALLVFSVVDGTPTTIHTLVDRDPAQRDAEALAQRIAATHPDAWAPQLLRDDLGGAALGRAGFAREALHQVLLVRQPRANIQAA